MIELGNDYTYLLAEKIIPGTLNPILHELYQSSYCVEEYFQTYIGPPELFRTIHLFHKGDLKHVFVFTIEAKIAILQNMMSEIPPEDADLFSKIIFASFPELNAVQITSSYNPPSPVATNTRMVKSDTDFVIPLPESTEAYLSMLGKQTRKHIKYYVNRASRDFPDFVFRKQNKLEITKDEIRKVIQMHRITLIRKQGVNILTEEYERKIGLFSAHYGMLCTVEMDGRTVAGTLSYLVDTSVFLHVLSFDYNYAKYNAGQVALFLTIEDLINKGYKKFHFLWGDLEYKKRFGGKAHDFYTYLIFKNNKSKLIWDIRQFYPRTIHFKNRVVQKLGLILNQRNQND
jgi:hypothetical protein